MCGDALFDVLICSKQQRHSMIEQPELGYCRKGAEGLLSKLYMISSHEMLFKCYTWQASAFKESPDASVEISRPNLRISSWEWSAEAKMDQEKTLNEWRCGGGPGDKEKNVCQRFAGIWVLEVGQYKGKVRSLKGRIQILYDTKWDTHGQSTLRCNLHWV